MQQWFFRGVSTHSKWFIAVCILICGFVSYQFLEASIIQVYSDRLSDSSPNSYANHTITFTAVTPIPAEGFIRFKPHSGEFEVPSNNFGVRNVALFVDEGSGYYERLTASVPSLSEDGVSITTGLDGEIEITLSSSQGIPANSRVQILIGNHTPNATTTDVGIKNPANVGTYDFHITAGDAINNRQVRGYYALVEKVFVGFVDTTETDPPIRFNGSPSGNISGTSISVQLSLRTNEFARCRLSTSPGTAYFSMGVEFSQTNFSIIHTRVVSVTPDTSYIFYIRCIDDEGNINIDDYEIGFTVLPTPVGTPGPDGEEEGQGSGTGEGAGDSDPGAGDPMGSDDTSGGASGGGGGGGGGGGSGASSGGSSGGGGFEGTNAAYQSGDGEVVISGFAFPRSTVVALIDGRIAREITSEADGRFSLTLSQIARGAYSFGVYAVDRNGTRSTTFSTTFTVTGARTIALTNINVLPSVRVTPDPVDLGGTVTISGYTVPNAAVTVENQSDRTSVGMQTFTTNSDVNGAWSVQVPTTGFSAGTYKARAKASQQGGVSTNFSGYTFYGVGQARSTAGSSDLNRDGRVNLTDFSILLFWWGTAGGNSNPPADINGDGRVNLTDFSILIFNWTG